MSDTTMYYKLFTVIDRKEEEISTFDIKTILEILECRKADKLHLRISEYNVITEVDRMIVRSNYDKCYLEKLSKDHFKDFLNGLVSFESIQNFKQWY